MTSQEQEHVGTGGEKSKKYDRQLRLWGDHGQAALEAAKVCLINATATGTEILKNLILPGVGSFTIVDGGRVSVDDLGNNFFFDKDSIGKSRAQVATELLLELNEDVSGDYVEESPGDLLENNASFFTSFDIVIACSLSEKWLVRLADILWEHDIPLIICLSYGFIGYMRLAVKEHTVVESQPDNVHEDLRLDRPFQGLVTFCENLDLSTMSKKDHMHTPWLVIIYQYLQQWKGQHGGEAPANYREKNMLKEQIRHGIRCNEDGVPYLEENFDEAIKNVNIALVPTRVPSDVQALFNDSSCKDLDQDSKPFWILVRAVKDFVESEGKGALPVRGTIPDMTADSERYISLQQVFRDQASQDVMAVTNHVQKLLELTGREELMSVEPRSQPASPKKPQDGITENDIKVFCKNAGFLKVLRYRSLSEEYTPNTTNKELLGNHLEDEDDDLVHYVLLRAVQRFFSEFNHYPGLDQDTCETDIPQLKSCLSKLLQEWGISTAIKDDLVHEYCRYGGSELHSVASYMGGAAAQEVIKVLTRQFVPINNTYIYNAMKQTSITAQL